MLAHTPLFDNMQPPAYPTDDDALDAVFAPVEVDESQLELDLTDYDEMAEDYAEDIEDRIFWAGGNW